MTQISSFDPSTSSVLPPPTKAEVRAVIPDECFERSTSTALRYAAGSLLATLLPAVLAWRFLPLTAAWFPVWVLYAVVVGTLAFGVWVIGHECGHGAFSPNKTLENIVGFVLHSALLVPYFSWQRSHAIHHAKTNHMQEGEAHVPPVAGSFEGKVAVLSRRILGPVLYPVLSLVMVLGIGWPLYLLVGLSGGLNRGTTNHFWPRFPFSGALFPKRWIPKVLWSAVGVFAVIGLLVWWAMAAASAVTVLALYVAPYVVCNAWLVGYTWLHHTSIDVPNYDEDEWSYMRGAFSTIDRPYGRVLDLVHHHLGSTHVAHHLFSRIPHYHAKRATDAVRQAFPEHYLYDPTPVPVALWEVARDCVTVDRVGNGWRFVEPLTGQPRVEA